MRVEAIWKHYKPLILILESPIVLLLFLILIRFDFAILPWVLLVFAGVSHLIYWQLWRDSTTVCSGCGSKVHPVFRNHECTMSNSIYVHGIERLNMLKKKVKDTQIIFSNFISGFRIPNSSDIDKETDEDSKKFRKNIIRYSLIAEECSNFVEILQKIPNFENPFRKDCIDDLEKNLRMFIRQAKSNVERTLQLGSLEVIYQKFQKQIEFFETVETISTTVQFIKRGFSYICELIDLVTNEDFPNIPETLISVLNKIAGKIDEALEKNWFPTLEQWRIFPPLRTISLSEFKDLWENQARQVIREKLDQAESLVIRYNAKYFPLPEHLEQILVEAIEWLNRYHLPISGNQKPKFSSLPKNESQFILEEHSTLLELLRNKHWAESCIKMGGILEFLVTVWGNQNQKYLRKNNVKVSFKNKKTTFSQKLDAILKILKKFDPGIGTRLQWEFVHNIIRDYRNFVHLQSYFQYPHQLTKLEALKLFDEYIQIALKF